MKIGLTSDQFWSLGFYDWKLYIERYEYEQKQKLDDLEMYLFVERIKIADFKNVHFRTEGGGQLDLKPTDVFRLSFDKIEKTSDTQMSMKEARALLGSKFKK